MENKSTSKRDKNEALNKSDLLSILKKKHKFKLIKKLGEGTYGSVFVVKDPVSGNLCAAKLIMDAFKNTYSAR